MLSVGLFPALALIAGATTSLALAMEPWWGLWLVLLAGSFAAIPAWLYHARRATTIALALGFWAAGALMTADAQQRAVETSLRSTLDREFGGFLVDAAGQEGAHPPLDARAVLIEDAVVRDTYVSLRARLIAIRIRGEWLAVDGGVIVSVTGSGWVVTLR